MSVVKEKSILSNEKLSKEWNYEKNCELNPQFDMSKRVDCELPIETFSIRELALDTGYSPHTSFISGIKATKEWIEKNGKV